MRSKRSLIVGLVLLLGAYALRLYRLDAQSLWWDEGISLHLATSSAAEIVRDRLDNIHPPLYFFILKGWLALTGVSPFTGRYLSALAGVAQVALVFAAANFWMKGALKRFYPAGDKRARNRLTTTGPAWLAGGLMLLSPLSVIYSQEVRVYALLPVVYLALLILAGRWLAGQRHGWAGLPGLAAVAWTALHLHYIALFAVGYVAAWGAWVLARRRDWPGLRRWTAAHAVVALATLPWLLAVIANWTAVQAEARAGTFTTQPTPLPFLFAQVWAFHLTGLAGSLSSQFVRVGAAVAAVLGGVLLVASGLDGAWRRPGGAPAAVARQLAAHWAVPLLAGLLVWSVRSFSHPRYIVMFAALLVPLATFLMLSGAGWPRRTVAALFGVAFVCLSLWGLRQYFFDPGVAKPDIRGVARYLESTAAPGDLILVPDTDWSLPFEYQGATPIVMPQVRQPPHEPGVLSAALDCSGEGPCTKTGRVFVVDYAQGGRDWQKRLPFELARRGQRVGATHLADVTVTEYRLAAQGPLPGCDTPGVARSSARFGPLTLEGVWIQQAAPADTAVAVALCWQIEEGPAAVAVASLLLRDDVTGERIAQVDTPLLDRDGAPVSFWRPGETVVTYHILPLPPGTPPLRLSLLGSVYTPGEEGPFTVEALDPTGAPLGRLLTLGEAALAAPSLAVPPEDGLPEGGMAVAPGLTLLNAVVDPGPYRPGQIVRARLLWRAESQLGDMRPALALEQGGETLAAAEAAPAQGRYPTDRWSAGEVVAEVRDLRIPGTAAGAANVVLIVDGARIDLGEVAIAGETVLFDRPPMTTRQDEVFGGAIALAGYDPPPGELDTATPVPITLYWHALSGDIGRNYSIFVHLLGEDGRLIAQHDGPPASGSRPTGEWLEGEYVIDAHVLEWREPGYTGTARLAVGLYDPQTGARLQLADGRDHVLLPFAPAVEAQP